MARTFTYSTVIVLFLATTGLAWGQESNTRKLFLQTSIDGQSLNYSDNSFSGTDGGGGFSFRAGWGISELATLYIGVNGSRLDGEGNGVISEEYEMGALEIGSRFNFRSGESWVPFVDIALRGVGVQLLDVDLEFAGAGIMIGGGVSYFVSPTIALTAGLRVGVGAFNEITLGNISAQLDDNEIGYSEARLSFGVIFYPLR